MIRATLIAAVLCLTACATPKERCLLQAQPDLTEIDALIAETEANLDRGYALEQGPISTVGVAFCTGSTARICIGGQSDIAGRPIAVDPDAEARKLKNLRERRVELQTRAADAMSACSALDS